MRKMWLLAVVLVCLASGQAMAKDINFITGLAQSTFKDLSREAGIALSYHNVAPSVSLGVTGFDVAVEATSFDIQKSKPYWQAAFAGDAPDFLVIPRLRVRKGLPFGIDVGAMYSYVPDSNIKLIGAEVATAVIDGGLLTPTLGLRGSYTKLTGVDQLDLQTIAIDANLSKGFAIVTPYVGAGMVWIDSKAKGQLASGTLPGIGVVALAEERIWQPRFFGGVKLSPLPLFAITGELEYSERPAYSLKAAINF